MEKQKVNYEVLISLVEHYLSEIRYALESRYKDDVKNDLFRSTILEQSLLTNSQRALVYARELNVALTSDVSAVKPVFKLLLDEKNSYDIQD